MTPSIDALLNQRVPLTSGSTTLSAAARSGVIEAVVLSNSPLLNNGETASASTQRPSASPVQVTLSDGRQRLVVTTQVPIPVGARVQLQVTENNQAVLLNINFTGSQSKSEPVAQSPGQAPGRLNGAAPATTTASPATIRDAQQSTAAVSPERLLIEQTLRRALPQQAPLRDLPPLLARVLQHSPALPRDLTLSLQHLQRQFPDAQALQQPATLKRAIRDSGPFFESKLAALAQRRLGDTTAAQRPAGDALTRPSTGAAEGPAGRTVNPDTPVNRDIKGLMERILPQLYRALPDGGDNRAMPSLTSPDLATLLQQTFSAPQSPPAGSAGAPNPAPQEQNVDVLLRQLGRLLLSTLAKTQVSQMESLAGRTAPTADAQAPVNSWHLEIPVTQGERVDNLGLRIEEHAGEEQQAGHKTRQWNVVLNFDLHELGKMQVQLAIVEKSVSATIWSQQAATHRQVQHYVQELQAGLESVGVTVKQVECRLGEMPDTRADLTQQLVDVRT